MAVAIAGWAIATQLVWPILRKVGYLAQSPQLNAHRARAVGISLVIVSMLAYGLFQAPVPLRTATEGVVWAPTEAEVRAGASAVVEQLIAEPGSFVSEGDPLVATTDPTLAAKVDALTADLEEARIRFRVARNDDQVEAEIIREEIRTLEASLALALERQNNLQIRSPTDGIFLLERPDDLVGQFVTQGQLIGFVADLSQGTIRVAVPQADIGLIRSSTRAVEIQFADDLGRIIPARISRESPAATYRLPSPALGTQGGGQLAVDPGDEAGTQTLDKVFHVELAVDRPVDRIGQRTYVRFDHGAEAIGWQWYRRLRQLLLSQLDA